MGLLSPIQLAWLAAIVVVALLYVRWAARKTHSTTTLPIWHHAFARRSWWTRWRRIASAAAACVPIVLIAVALAQPFLTPAVESSRTLVIVLDNTASMNAQSRGRSRLEEGKREARRLIRNLRTHDRMAILSADSAVRVRCGLTGDRSTLHLALDEVQPTAGTGAMDACIDTAQRLVHGEPRPIVVVISDGAFPMGEAANGDEVVWIPVGEIVGNLAITRIAARPALGDNQKHQVLIEIANFGESPTTAALTLQQGDELFPTEEITVSAGERVQRINSVTVDDAALLKATLDVDDALAADNTASLLLAPRAATKVVLVSDRQDSPLERALASLSHVRLTKATVPPANIDAESILVFDGTVPELLPDRPALIFRPRSSSAFWNVRGSIAQPEASASVMHPLLEGVDLRDVIIDEAAELDFGGGAKNANAIVQSTTGQPLISTISRPAGDIVVVSFDMQDSDFAQHDDFPKFVASAVKFLASRQAATSTAWQTSDTLVLHDDGRRELTSPYGKSYSIGANLIDVGAWRVQNDDASAAAVLPVNLADERESNLQIGDAPRNRKWPHIAWLPDLGPLWMMLVALALVWMAGHWAWLQRGTLD